MIVSNLRQLHTGARQLFGPGVCINSKCVYKLFLPCRFDFFQPASHQKVNFFKRVTCDGGSVLIFF
jgi:hypothetical protein